MGELREGEQSRKASWRRWHLSCPEQGEEKRPRVTSFWRGTEATK
jgi:phage terminase large subunit GpA-like protein